MHIYHISKRKSEIMSVDMLSVHISNFCLVIGTIIL